MLTSKKIAGDSSTLGKLLSVWCETISVQLVSNLSRLRHHLVPPFELRISSRISG
jgi:hypothetical protein